MDSDFLGLASALRAAGIRRAGFEGAPSFHALREVELFDTIPAPPPEPELPVTEHAELKPDNQCGASGCAETGGWMGTRFCRAHGLGHAGVKS